MKNANRTDFPSGIEPFADGERIPWADVYVQRVYERTENFGIICTHSTHVDGGGNVVKFAWPCEHCEKYPAEPNDDWCIHCLEDLAEAQTTFHQCTGYHEP